MAKIGFKLNEEKLSRIVVSLHTVADSLPEGSEHVKANRDLADYLKDSENWTSIEDEL